jgi:hypothetical protein
VWSSGGFLKEWLDFPGNFELILYRKRPLTWSTRRGPCGISVHGELTVAQDIGLARDQARGQLQAQHLITSEGNGRGGGSDAHQLQRGGGGVEMARQQ